MFHSNWRRSHGETANANTQAIIGSLMLVPGITSKFCPAIKAVAAMRMNKMRDIINMLP